MADIRNQKLMSLAQMSINGQVTHKLDQIASVYINEQPYFNVFRRYNSPYNIVIEDYTGDIYLRKDKTVRKSLKSVLCLSSDEINKMYTIAAASFKHNGPVPNDAYMIPDMRWSELQGEYQAITVTFGGILDGNHRIQQEYQEPDLLAYYGQTQTNPSSSRKRPAEDSVDELFKNNAIVRPLFEHIFKKQYMKDKVKEESIEQEEEDESIEQEEEEEEEEEEESDEQEKEEESDEQEEESDEQEEESRLRNSKRSWCDNDESEEQDESDESEKQDDSKYVVLRNGHKIRKTSK